MKNGLLSGGLNPGPLGHESSALQLDHESPQLNIMLSISIFMNLSEYINNETT
jgi:hypothetical protein